MTSESVIAKLPTTSGEFEIKVWPSQRGQEPAVLSTPNLDINKPVTVRMHSECLTGDVLGSLRCDCGEQLKQSLEKLTKSGNGVLIYLRQEGRGIGLYEKIRAYGLQEDGLDTYEANIKLGHEPDERDYEIAVHILRELGVKEIVLLTNNPEKVIALKDASFEVRQEELLITPTAHNQRYLETKRDKFNHTT